MHTDNNQFRIAEPEKYSEGGFYSINDALSMITYSQDKSLVMQSYKRLCDKTGRKQNL
jgi:hypothetical protein